MKKIFICSPYRGNIEENTKKAAYYGKIAVGADMIPIIPHLYFPLFLDENNPNKRMKGIEMGLELLETCDEVYVFGFNITEGMKLELNHARKKKKLVRLYDEGFNKVNIKTISVDERATHEYLRVIRGLRLK